MKSAPHHANNWKFSLKALCCPCSLENDILLYLGIWKQLIRKYMRWLWMWQQLEFLGWLDTLHIFIGSRILFRITRCQLDELGIKNCLKDNLCLHVQKLIVSLTSICLSLQRKQKNLLYTISVGVQLTFYYLKKGRSRSPITDHRDYSPC